MVKLKAYGYVRVSGKGQVSGDGPVRQEQSIREYAAVNNIDLIKVYLEAGVSGDIETVERPAFLEMVTAIMSNGVKTVIVERLDRLSRRYMTQEACIADFTKRGITLLSTSTGELELMATDPARVLVRQIMGSIAEYDKALLVAKLRAARQRKRATGVQCEGAKPYGSRPGEDRAVDRIQELRSENYAYDRIAAILEAEGVPTRKVGGKWVATQVKRILARCYEQA